MKKPLALLIILAFLLPACGPNDPPKEPVDATNLNAGLLEESLELGTSFLLNNQKKEGNFNYEYNFDVQTFNPDDSEVRQAGALWGIALIHQNNPSDETQDALIKGVDFFEGISTKTGNGSQYIVYDNAKEGRTGTIALVSLALIEWLRADGKIENRGEYEQLLNEYLQFLLSLRQENGQFYSTYDTETGLGAAGPSPYFDGETLLALIKAAKYQDYATLKGDILESAEAMYQTYGVEARESNPDSDLTKGFYQWGSMSFYELYTSDWEGVEEYADRTIELGYWMIDIHQTLDRTRNTAYAYEGLILAWELARLTDNQEAMDKISAVIEEGLFKLTSWQVGSPNQNEFLLENLTEDPIAIGGVMNKRDEFTLRIDVCQHQMHAVILALRYYFK